MAGKKIEGNEQQRRSKAREARKRGSSPSAESATQGASRQPHHLPRHDDQVEKQQTPSQGKQRAPKIDVEAQKNPRTRRWHRDHEHDPQKHPHPRDTDTSEQGEMPPYDPEEES